MLFGGDQLQVQVFRESLSVGEEFFAPLGGCCRVYGSCFGMEAGKEGRAWL